MAEQDETRDTLEREERVETGLSPAEAEEPGMLEGADMSEPDSGDAAGAGDDARAGDVVAAGGAPAAEAALAGGAEESGDGDSAVPEGSRRKRWYVIHTYSGHENKVKANMERAIQYARLQDRFGEILVATEDYAIMKAGKKQITKRKTFPSYVLVEMAMDDESRALVQNIPGVTNFVGDKNPTALTEAEVRRIRGEEVREVGKVTTEVPFKVGESVKVTQGPFADFVGSVDEINLERGKLRVMVSIFGRATAVELDLTHVTSI